MIKLLLQNKADINNVDIIGNTPLSTAIEIDNFEAIKLLCNAGVSLINIQKPNNSSAFHVAIPRAFRSTYLLRQQSKKYIETFITHTRFDDLPRIALEMLLILKKQYPETYKDLHDLTLSKLLASNNIDNLDDFKKKMGQELSIMTTYKDPILAQVYKRILRLKEILQMQNNQNQTALELLHIDFNVEDYSDYPDDLQCIKEVGQLLDGTKLDDDFNKLEVALKDINLESKTKLTLTELISALESKLGQSNLVL